MSELRPIPNDFLAHLDTYRDADDEAEFANDQAAEGEPPFRVDTLERAAWAARKLRRALERVDEVERVAAREAARIEAWRVMATKNDRDEASYFRALLEAYHRTELAADEKRKTVKLPEGVTLKHRRKPERWTFGDGFLAWAQEHAPDVLRRPDPQVDKPAAKKRLAAADAGGEVVDRVTGEVVPGVTVEPGDESFVVEVDA